jgi:DNA end-binding protein Ku
VIRTKEYLCAVMAKGDLLVLETLRYAYELRDPAELDVPEDDLEALGLTKPEITMAEQLIEAMTTGWQPEAYRDEYRDDLLRVIAEKERTGTVEAVAAGEPAPEGQVVDIMTLLKRSVDQVREAEEQAGDAERGAGGEEAPDKKKAAPKRGGKGGRRKAA